MVDSAKVQEAKKETRRLLESSDLFEAAIGGGRREVLKELDLWEDHKEDKAGGES